MSFFKKKSRKSTSANTQTELPQKNNDASALDINLERNLATFKDLYGNSSDLVIRKIQFGEDHKLHVGMIYLDGLVDKQMVEDLLDAFMFQMKDNQVTVDSLEKDNVTTILKNTSIPIAETTELHHLQDMESAILSGGAILLIDGVTSGLKINISGWAERGVNESSTENVVRGPKESFTETLRTNTSLVRRKIKDSSLRIEELQVGKVTKTEIAIVHIQGIANEKIVEEVRNRIKLIEIDSILESSYIEELIEDKTYTTFPTLYNTERPDVIAAGLLEGRVAIFVDGTPFVLLAPALFTHFFQSAEDYYQRWDIATLLRMLRVLAFFISLLGPSLYIALINFHQEMLPTTLLIDLAAQREGVPFPAVIEALLMEVTLEILREAGLRLPKAIGQTVSIVGALVIGQTAVEAGIVSAVMVIVVSITAISNFTLPSYSMAISIRILRFGFIIFSATFGLFGITIGLFLLTLHLCSLRSFGVPFLTPISPFVKEDQKDTLWRLPTWKRYTRPRLVSKKNNVREDQMTSQNIQLGKRSEG
ncbi:spore germination protein [Bacillus sp. CHD6a]|uniref:spore germination protein n=1 Tax=Bacillus sp. CHD6a TaxID=1643452 RepID=UPI0006CD5667|nr:spore germination protein [Bacillus sp. CHD6a]KPB04198.1 spore gernimation protein KA [Bacillus sp. CHD6a]